MNHDVYVLGHSDSELQRLAAQARYVGDLTEDVLRRAGLAPGMRVLDLGCGLGDVSFLAASLVGPGGRVHGIDRAPDAIAKARERAAHAGLNQVTFDIASVMDVAFDASFDAIIGRLVLLHLPDPLALLGRIAKEAAPGTLVVFHEMELSTGRSMPEAPLCNQGMRLLIETFRGLGVETEMGAKLWGLFCRAGLPAPQLLLAAHVEGGPDAFVYHYLAHTLRTLLPAAKKLGIDGANDIDLDTFAARLRDEIVAMNGVMQAPAYTGAWTRV
jgi:SAM-dependent methyltransferase